MTTLLNPMAAGLRPERPTPVEVVRPRRTKPELIGNFIGYWLDLLVDAWIVMVLVPVVVHSWHPGYGQAVAALVIAKSTHPSSFFTVNMWTREARKPKKVQR